MSPLPPPPTKVYGYMTTAVQDIHDTMLGLMFADDFVGISDTPE